MPRKIDFSVENVKIIENLDTSSFAQLSIDLFSSGNNAHNLPVSEETLRKTASTILNKPLIWNMSRYGMDIGSHERIRQEYPFVCGFIPETSRLEYSQLADGRIMLSVDALIWKKYSQNLFDFLERDDYTKPISVEISIGDSKKLPDGSEELLDFTYDSVCILGSQVLPAIKDAQLNVVKFSKEYEEDYQREFAKKFTLEKSKYSQFDYSYAKEVKEKYASIWKKGGITKGETVFSNWEKAINGDNSQFISDWVAERESYAKRHFNEKSLSGVVGCMKWGIVVSRGEQFMKDLIDGQKKEYDAKNSSFFSEEQNIVSEEKDNFANQEGDKENKMENTEEENKKESGEVFEESAPVEEKKEEMADTKEQEKTETPEEEKQETPEEEKKEKEEGTEMASPVLMSLDSYLDVSATLAFLEDETEGNQEEVAEDETKPETFAKEFVSEKTGKFAKRMFSKMCKMAEDLKAVKQENMELKKFKAEVEAFQMAGEVEKTLSEVMAAGFPRSEAEMAKEEAKNFSLETIDIWKNAVKAKAFSHIKEPKSTQAKLGWGQFIEETKQSTGSIWDKYITK